ncbi:MerR family transcriptional regulator [Gordonia sp. DT30]|uniref:MerR family transcriptional regulator n=1 Tax=unclassified Gordonia (in: high G+C Gram-positive bacteria) TaxID=2657482 RepID=UPI003CEFF678
MKIGELAQRTGVSVRALRYYEEQGLLTSDRTPGGHRDYADDAVERVRFFQLMYSAGLSSRRIADMLPCLDTGTTDQEQLQMLSAERRRLDTRITELTAARDRLDAIIDNAYERVGTADAV